MNPLIKREKTFNEGYNIITDMSNDSHKMQMDIGVLILRKGKAYFINETYKEVAVLLISGNVTFSWEGTKVEAVRDSFMDENPWCLHVGKGVNISLYAEQNSELIIQKTDNDRHFKSKLYSPKECKSEVFGNGILNETSNRTVRTIFDYNSAPYSNMVIGEVINHPGRWSSYPPHSHPQPEVYLYKFMHSQGFGVSVIDDDAFVVRSGDAICIPSGKVHPQVAAPGYPMWYCWMIRHLNDSPFKDRFFQEEHKWLLDPNAKIWPKL